MPKVKQIWLEIFPKFYQTFRQIWVYIASNFFLFFMFVRCAAAVGLLVRKRVGRRRTIG